MLIGIKTKVTVLFTLTINDSDGVRPNHLTAIHGENIRAIARHRDAQAEKPSASYVGVVTTEGRIMYADTALWRSPFPMALDANQNIHNHDCQWLRRSGA
jgi:hypothetical protein